MIKNIIFDWSGVISNDFRLVYKTAMRIFDCLGAQRISFETYAKEVAIPPINFYKKFVKNPDMNEINEMFKNIFPTVGKPTIYEGAKEVIKQLHDKGLKLIVLSTHTEVDNEAREYGIHECFKEINTNVHDKIAVINEVLKRNSFLPSETAYVGDMTHDIKAGKAGGVKTIAITWGYDSKDKLEKVKPDFVIDDLKELDYILQDIF